MFNHVIVPIDCSDDARRDAARIARYVAPLNGAKVTLVASVSPSIDPVFRTKKMEHARQALSAIGDIMFERGIRTGRLTLEETTPLWLWRTRRSRIVSLRFISAAHFGRLPCTVHPHLSMLTLPYDINGTRYGVRTVTPLPTRLALTSRRYILLTGVTCNAQGS